MEKELVIDTRGCDFVKIIFEKTNQNLSTGVAVFKKKKEVRVGLRQKGTVVVTFDEPIKPHATNS